MLLLILYYPSIKIFTIIVLNNIIFIIRYLKSNHICTCICNLSIAYAPCNPLTAHIPQPLFKTLKIPNGCLVFCNPKHGAKCFAYTKRISDTSNLNFGGASQGMSNGHCPKWTHHHRRSHIACQTASLIPRIRARQDTPRKH